MADPPPGRPANRREGRQGPRQASSAGTPRNVSQTEETVRSTDNQHIQRTSAFRSCLSMTRTLPAFPLPQAQPARANVLSLSFPDTPRNRRHQLRQLLHRSPVGFRHDAKHVRTLRVVHDATFVKLHITPARYRIVVHTEFGRYLDIARDILAHATLQKA